MKSNLGMSIVPDVAVAQRRNYAVRPSRPAVPATLALIEHRNKPNDVAVDTVHDALLEMRGNAVIAPVTKRTRQRR